MDKKIWYKGYVICKSIQGYATQGNGIWPSLSTAKRAIDNDIALTVYADTHCSFCGAEKHDAQCL